MKKAMDYLVKEYQSYSGNIRIALYVLFFLAAGFVVFAIQILLQGLRFTDMSNFYPFGFWIIGDLGLVALGGGAFTTGFILYILRNDKLEPMINSTVLIGFLCYLFTLVFLILDIGQPIRAWFGYTYPNWGNGLMPRSMLTEVVWCLTFYFIILCIEMIPVVLKHRVLDGVPVLHKTAHYLHKLMWIFAAAGTFLSFFHQGSLGGGMWGVLYAKPAWFEPFYFFTAITGAMAGGTSFMTLCVYIAGRVMKKHVVPARILHSITRISGFMFIVYLIFRVIDISLMVNKYVPLADRSFIDLWGGYYGLWMLVVEFTMTITAIILLFPKKLREQEKLMLTGIICGVLSTLISKFITVLHGSSVPNFPWKDFISYNPTIQEWFIMIGGLAVMVLVYMCFVAYTPLFPDQESE